MSSEPRAVPSATETRQSRGRSPTADGSVRASSMARLVSPIPSVGSHGALPVRQIPVPGQSPGSQTPLAGVEGDNSFTAGPGRSALAAAFQGSMNATPPTHGTPPVRNFSPTNGGHTHPTANPNETPQQTTYGSFESRSVPQHSQKGSFVPIEDPKVIKRHLVQPSDNGSKQTRFANDLPHLGGDGAGSDDEAFSSLKLQGGDVHREVYRWTQDAESSQSAMGRRSQSWYLSRPEPEDETLDINSIRVPGGFRRDHLRRRAPSPTPGKSTTLLSGDTSIAPNSQNFISRNFLEFLTLYGHFAGEELEDDDEDSYFGTGLYDGDFAAGGSDGEEEPGEGSALLTPSTPGRRRRKTKERGTPGTNTPMGAVLLLLKSFVGTGVLFLPRAYLNGGMLFSNLVLLGVASLSYYCFILLVRTRLEVVGSFGDIGGILYGKWLRSLILASVVLSQIGFVAAYIVFTSESMQAFFTAVSRCRTWIDIRIMVLVQLVIFLPLSLIRDISKLGVTALVADAFILLGLVYLGYFDIFTIVQNHGVADIVPFNSKNWTLFIGTAIFTFEGVGLIIPIQESMKEPAKFPPVLAGVMIIITVIFITIGALSYAAFGSATKTVVLLNLPQENKFVNAVQLLYSLAILLSTPLQLFPAIRIMESELFSRSGKHSAYIKWQKNVFRFVLVIGCALIAWGGAGDLDKFVSLVGSFACVPLVYVYPAMLHYKAVAKTRRQKFADCILCMFGLFAMAYTTVQTIRSWASSTAVKSPGYCDGRNP